MATWILSTGLATTLPKLPRGTGDMEALVGGPITKLESGDTIAVYNDHAHELGFHENRSATAIMSISLPPGEYLSGSVVLFTRQEWEEIAAQA